MADIWYRSQLYTFKRRYHCNIRVLYSSNTQHVFHRLASGMECGMKMLNAVSDWVSYSRICGSHFHKTKNGRKDGYIRAAYCHSSRGMYFIQITDIRQAVGRFYRSVGGLCRINSEIIKKKPCRVQHYDVKRLSMAQYSMISVMHYALLIIYRYKLYLNNPIF